MADTQKRKFGIDAFTLHVLAMAFMLSDHVWATVGSAQEWLTAVGRLAFPIFAFMLAEGFRRTKSVKRYALRLAILALISEVPFDLMYGATVFYPFHQNVIFTFLIALLCMLAISSVKKLGKAPLTALACIAAAGAGWFLGTLLMTDYGGEGVLTVLLFYIFPGEKRWQKVCQLVGMAVLNCVLLASLVYPVSIFGLSLELPEQGLALLSLIPIWLYSGEQGIHTRAARIFCYAFYPAHMLILALCMIYI